MAKPAPGTKSPASRAGRSAPLKPPPLKVDPERFPHVEKNPGLERALRIRQALDKGLPRDEAVRLADDAMGPRSPVGHAMPVPKRRPASGSRAARRTAPSRKPAARALTRRS